MSFTFDEIERYQRQVLLPEWGAAGQERVRAARVEVRGRGDAAEIARLYLAGAGVGGVTTVMRDAPLALVVDGAPVVAASGDGEAERIALGAACAVEALKAILGLPHRACVSLRATDDAAPGAVP